MPMDRRRYPPDWEAVRARVLERAQGQCECRGECGVDHALEPYQDDPDNDSPRCAAVHDHHHPVTGSLVVLTTAHLWRGPCAEHDRAGVKCGELEHLAAMCQACHLRYDRPHHVANARRTRRSKRATGDLFG